MKGAAPAPSSQRMSVQGDALGMREKAKDRNVLLRFPLKTVFLF